MTSVYERRCKHEPWEYLGSVTHREVAEEAINLFLRFAPPMEYRLEEADTNSVPEPTDSY
jgi:hypothetical protein